MLVLAMSSDICSKCDERFNLSAISSCGCDATSRDDGRVGANRRATGTGNPLMSSPATASTARRTTSASSSFGLAPAVVWQP